MDKLLIALIVSYLLFFPSFISEQYHSSAGFILNLTEKPLISELGARRWALETGLVEENSLAYKIIDCESKWKPNVCNNDYNCRAGIGLWQIVVSTWNQTIVRMSENNAYMPERCWQLMRHPISCEKREIIFDGECNLLVGLYLLENEGNKHWDMSKSCWDK